ncbi:MAG: hypothetical protein ACREAU_03455 [Nitrosopumilaceae archaeon]
MKIKELLAFKLEKTTIFEMAFSRRNAWMKITGISYPLSEHVIKLLIFPYSLDRKHWIKEINGWLRPIQDIILKPQNRRLAFIEYRDWLFDEPELNPADLIRHIKIDYPEEQLVVPQTINQDFSNIMIRLCNELATDTFEGIEKYFTSIP